MPPAVLPVYRHRVSQAIPAAQRPLSRRSTPLVGPSQSTPLPSRSKPDRGEPGPSDRSRYPLRCLSFIGSTSCPPENWSEVHPASRADRTPLSWIGLASTPPQSTRRDDIREESKRPLI